MFRVLLRLGHLCDTLGRACAFAAAGTLSFADFRELQRREWSVYCTDPADVLSGLFLWEQRLFAAHLRPGDRILVAGSGTGRDVIPLLAAGYDVVALEFAPGANSVAKQVLAARGIAIQIVEGGIEDAELPSQFDAIVLSNRMYSYVPVRSRRVAALRRLSSALKPGGRVLLSYLEVDRPMSDRSVRLSNAVARLCRTDWRLEPHDTFLHRDRAGILRYEHLFLPAHAAEEAVEAGYRIVEHEYYMGAQTLALVRERPVE
jgi:SAM-dependent methyltransferase